MQKVVSIISIIIYLGYYYFLNLREIKKDKDNNKLFYLIRLDSLFYLVTFYIYKGFNKEAVSIYLYFIFMFSSLVFILYDLNDNYDLKKQIKIDRIYYIIGLGILIIPLIYYLKTNNIINMYFITLIINLLIPLIIYIVKRFKK